MKSSLWFPILLGIISLFLLGTRWGHAAQNLTLRVLAPLETGFTRAVAPVVYLRDIISQRSDLRSENEAQRRLIDQLTSEIARLQEAALENQRLRSLLHYTDTYGEGELLGATVISREPNNLLRSLTINKGSNDGIRQGMVVLAEGGLVGKVSQVHSSSAKVLLITDHRSATNALIQPSRAAGVVRGQQGNLLTMDYVAQGEQVTVGDLVVTSGLGGGFPKGILIGQVVAAKNNDVKMFQEVEVRPIMNFLRLEEVLVIMNFVPSTLE
ncbi:MAG: rod shape-determining protein MreC [Chloroflexi bacterium]|nr:rod shape-determining protein MreC [Chloroflexota bacterium]